MVVMLECVEKSVVLVEISEGTLSMRKVKVDEVYWFVER